MPFSNIPKDRFRGREEELGLLSVLANQAAIAIEKAQERKERLDAIRAIGYDITAGTNLEQILKDLLHRTLALVQEGSMGEIWLLDEKTKMLQIRVRYGELATEVKELGVGEGIVGHVANTKEPYLTGNVEADKHFVRGLVGTLSEMAVPLFKGDQLIGVLNVEHAQANAFTRSEDIPLLEALASQVVIALENARQYEQRIADIGALQEINESITTKDWNQIAEMITRKAKELTQAEYSRLWMIEGNHLVPGAVSSGGDARNELAIDEKSINGWVVLSGRFYNCPDVRQDSHYRMWREEIRSTLAVPVRFRDRIIGTLDCESARLNAFSAQLVKLLQSLADQSAIAIENTRRMQELEVLNQIGKELAASLVPLQRGE